MTIDQIMDYLKNIKERDTTSQKVSEVNESLKRIKDGFVGEDNQREAKITWCFEQILKIQNAYLEAYQQMKQKDFYEAWCTLEHCESELGSLTPHFSTGDDAYSLTALSPIAKSKKRKRKISQTFKDYRMYYPISSGLNSPRLRIW